MLFQPLDPRQIHHSHPVMILVSTAQCRHSISHIHNLHPFVSMLMKPVYFRCSSVLDLKWQLAKADLVHELVSHLSQPGSFLFVIQLIARDVLLVPGPVSLSFWAHMHTLTTECWQIIAHYAGIKCRRGIKNAGIDPEWPSAYINVILLMDNLSIHLRWSTKSFSKYQPLE